ncbi:MAG: DUF3604 domain-containing protein [Defluviitaleaceae bacterium]|nr:DUF3604 domain-containing protein [Defluviitaleaceae bacterium]
MSGRFKPSGIRKYPEEQVAEIERGRGVSLVEGATELARCTGHKYAGGMIFSFTGIWEAAAITMTEGEELSWLTAPSGGNFNGGAVYAFEYAMGNGAAYPQPNGAFVLCVDGLERIRFSMKKHSHLFERNGCRLYLEVKQKKAVSFGECFTLDEFIQNESVAVSGIAYLYLPEGGGAAGGRLRLTVTPANLDRTSMRWFRVGWGGIPVTMCKISEGIEALFGERMRRTVDGTPVWFGDIHVHSAETTYHDGGGCGRASVAENYAYARDVSGLDFCAVTEHDWQMNARDWENLRSVTDSFNEDGRFAALHAFEWTSFNYGHRNVYFRGAPKIPKGMEAFDYRETRRPVKYGLGFSERNRTPCDLWDWLGRNGFDAMTIPHHPNVAQFPMSINHFHSEKYDRAVEVYSCWGSLIRPDSLMNLNVERFGELGIKDYLRKRLAFIASGDAHDGNAGDSNVANYNNLKQFAHYLGSGRVAAICGELTRESVYDAIHEGRCYAVTGEPIALSFRVNGTRMGGALTEASKKNVCEVNAEGTDAIERVTFFKNGEPVYFEKGFEGNSIRCEWEDENNKAARDAEAAYFVEIVQRDGEAAWSSPVWSKAL